MPFIGANGLTEEGTRRTITDSKGMTIHYHDIGEGPPVMFVHTYGPGSTAWITWHKVIGAFAQHFRCIMMDMVNFGRSGPEVFNEPVHSVQSRAARVLMDALDIPSAMYVGNSMGGTVSIVQAIEAPERVTKIVVGGSHASTGGDPYIIANFPSQGLTSVAETTANPTRDNFIRYLKTHIYDEALATDPELVDYVMNVFTSAQDHRDANAKSVVVPHSNLQSLSDIKVPVKVVQGRFDRMVTVEQAFMLIGYMPQADLAVLNRCGHWAPFERPEEYVQQVLPFLLKN